MTFSVHQQTHGYKSGHQLLSASIRLQPTDQEVIDRLSDMAGPLRPNERFEPYLTAYPLPSGSYTVKWSAAGADSHRMGSEFSFKVK